MSSSPSVALWVTGWAVATGITLLTGQAASSASSDDTGVNLDDSGISTPSEPEIDPYMALIRPPAAFMEPGQDQWLWGPYLGQQTCEDTLASKGEVLLGSSSYCSQGSDDKWYFWWVE